MFVKWVLNYFLRREYELILSEYICLNRYVDEPKTTIMRAAATATGKILPSARCLFRFWNADYVAFALVFRFG